MTSASGTGSNSPDRKSRISSASELLAEQDRSARRSCAAAAPAAARAAASAAAARRGRAGAPAAPRAAAPPHPGRPRTADLRRHRTPRTSPCPAHSTIRFARLFLLGRLRRIVDRLRVRAAARAARRPRAPTRVSAATVLSIDARRPAPAASARRRVGVEHARRADHSLLDVGLVADRDARFLPRRRAAPRAWRRRRGSWSPCAARRPCARCRGSRFSLVTRAAISSPPDRDHRERAGRDDRRALVLRRVLLVGRVLRRVVPHVRPGDEHHRRECRTACRSRDRSSRSA